ncbi:MAG: hypothetical protein R2758_00580 [Bacteroidales bacterium]
MKRCTAGPVISMSLALILVLASCLKASGQEDFIRKEALKHDFQQFRQLLEEKPLLPL